MSEPTAPAVPLTLPPSRQAMAISQAMRQAAVDAANAPRTLSFGFVWEQHEGIGVVVRVQGKDAHGEVQWEAPYDTRGHRVTVGGGIRF